MLANIGISFLGIIVFLFIFWKRLKEDYISEIVFKSAFYVLIGVFLSYALSYRFFPSWFLWSSLVGAIIGLLFGILTLRIKFYEAFEALIISFLPWIALVFLADSVVHFSLSSFLAFTATLIIIFISYWVGDHYKNFAWYKSGRIGFAGLTTLTLIFITRFAIAISGIHVLSFVSLKYEAIVSGVLVLTSLLLIYNLGRNQK